MAVERRSRATTPACTMKTAADPVVAKARAERRRFRRVRIDCPARLFVPADAREAACKIVDLSPGGASVECAVVPDAGTQVVLYVDGFGRFEGTVARREGEWFGVKFAGTHLLVDLWGASNLADPDHIDRALRIAKRR